MKKGWFKRFLSTLLTVSILGSTALPMVSIAAQQESLTVTGGKVLSLSEPLGIEGTPSFSWTVESTQRNDAQKAYRLIVAKSQEDAAKGNATVWDSGRVESDNTIDVVYEGPALESRTFYYWRVTVYSTRGGEADSAVFRFSTGVQSEEWTGEWIGYPQEKGTLNLTGSKWIWLRAGAAFASSPAGEEYFRFSFDIPETKTVSDFEIAFSADDSSTVWLNGREIGSTSLWSDGSFYRGTAPLQTGKNTVAIKAANGSAGYAGLVAKLKVSYTDGSADEYITDKSWKVTKSVSGLWQATDYDDSSWQTPDQAENFGASPWGTGIGLKGNASRAATVLRKEFTVEKEIKEALVSLCGLGFFDLTVNGKSPDDSVLNPFTTQYDEAVYYRTFDLSELLTVGDNAIGVELGNSYYNEIGGVWNWASASWRDEPKLMLRLDIRYTDGSEETIVSDTSWKVTKDGPITANSMYYGDVYDARKALDGFDKAAYDDSAWVSASVMAKPLGKLEAQMKAPVARVASFTPEEIVKLGDGSWRVESPEMIAGWVLLKNINQEAGDKITLTYGQKLNPDGSVLKYGYTDGELASWYPHAYFQQDIYYSAGGKNESYEPKFSYKGFEYVQIDGFEGELKPEDVIIYRVSNDVEILSEFSSSNEMFNKLHKSMLVALADNFQGEHCDPMLEKNGWLGDANVSLTSLMFNFDMAATLPAFIELMEDAQDQYGYVPQMVPAADWGIQNTAVWNTIFIYGVQDLENYFGTYSYSEVQYEEMRKMAVRDINEMRVNGWVWHDNQLADWVAPIGGSNPNVAYNENMSEGSGIVGTAFVYGTLQYMAELAERLGRTADVKTYTDAMASIYEAFNKKFYNSSKQIYETRTWSQIGTRTKYRQTSNLVPLAFGLVPEEYVEGVLENLIKDIVEKDYHLDTGCVGTRYILPVLCDYGYADVAYRIATQTTYPSWGFWLENGAKSTWEMWESTTRSFDHYFLGTYEEWFFTHLAGIKEVDDGYGSFVIDPELIGDLDFVNASVKTVRGTLASSWERSEGNTFTMNITVPFGSVATVLLPTADVANAKLHNAALSASADGVRALGTKDGYVAVTVGSGNYVFTVQADDEAAPVYRASLSLAIDKASSYLENAEYAAEKEALSEAINAAKAVLENDGASQLAINRATEALEAFLCDMIGSEAKNALREAVANSRQANSKCFYPAEAWKDYRAALTSAEALLYDKNASDASFEKALTDLKAAEAVLVTKSYVNLALGKSLTASSTHEDSYWNWGIRLATDGDRVNASRQEGEYAGYCSSNTPTIDHAEWLAIDLGETTAINTAVFYPASTLDGTSYWGYGFPDAFSIEVSADGVSWQEVYADDDYPLPAYGPLVFTFDEVTARYVRLNAKSLRPKVSDNNSYRLQITEFEVYNLPATTPLDTTALASAFASAEALLSTDTYTGAAETARTAFDAALAKAKRLLADDGALQEELTAALEALKAAEKNLEEQRAPVAPPVSTASPSPSPSPTPDTTDDPGSTEPAKGLPVGAWIGIAAAVVVVIGAAVAVLLLRRKKS